MNLLLRWCVVTLVCLWQGREWMFSVHQSVMLCRWTPSLFLGGAKWKLQFYKKMNLTCLLTIQLSRVYIAILGKNWIEIDRKPKFGHHWLTLSEFWLWSVKFGKCTNIKYLWFKFELMFLKQGKKIWISLNFCHCEISLTSLSTRASAQIVVFLFWTDTVSFWK